MYRIKLLKDGFCWFELEMCGTDAVFAFIQRFLAHCKTPKASVQIELVKEDTMSDAIERS